MEVKGKLVQTPQGRRQRGEAQHFLQAAEWKGGAGWAGSSQLVAFEAFPTAVGEGQPREVGSGPGTEGGGRGPTFPVQQHPLPGHVVHSYKHRPRWAHHLEARLITRPEPVLIQLSRAERQQGGTLCPRLPE